MYFLLIGLLFVLGTSNAQEESSKPKTGHKNINKFKQLYDEFSTPNMYRAASGAPGVAYYQQQADYKMDIVLDDKNAKISGSETITYTNNSPDVLKYLWVQLEQNKRAKDSKSPLIESSGIAPVFQPSQFASEYLKGDLERGFNIQEVKDTNGKPLEYMINRTMMRIELPKALQSKEKFSFSITSILAKATAH